MQQEVSNASRKQMLSLKQTWTEEEGKLKAYGSKHLYFWIETVFMT